MYYRGNLPETTIRTDFYGNVAEIKDLNVYNRAGSYTNTWQHYYQ